jgi:cyanate permease
MRSIMRGLVPAVVICGGVVGIVFGIAYIVEHVSWKYYVTGWAVFSVLGIAWWIGKFPGRLPWEKRGSADERE